MHISNKVWKVESFRKSIFSDVYFEAYNALINIVNSQTGLKKSKVKARNFDINNIIAFVGDRGSGKTSCMRNFRRSLKEKRGEERIDFYKSTLEEKSEYKRIDFDKSTLKDKDGNELKDIPRKRILELRYEILTVIDPSLFSIKDSLIEIVVAQMFNRFKDKYTEKDEESFSDKQNLVKQFEKVYKDIRVLNTNKESLYNGNYDELEALVALGSAISLKDDMSNLVESYIKYMSSGKEGYLVISIDDIDMNLRVGEKMLEDIRKYLMIPNVIILIAVKMEQLKQIVQQRYLVYLKDNELLEKEIDNIKEEKSNLLEDFKENIINITDKYLEKVIPYNRRIRIPNLSEISKIYKLNVNIEYFRNLVEKLESNFLVIENDIVTTDKFKEIESNIEKSILEIDLDDRLNREKNEELDINKSVELDKEVYKNLRKFIELIIFLDKSNEYLFRIKEYTRIKDVNDIGESKWFKSEKMKRCKNNNGHTKNSNWSNF